MVRSCICEQSRITGKEPGFVEGSDKSKGKKKSRNETKPLKAEQI